MVPFYAYYSESAFTLSMRMKVLTNLTKVRNIPNVRFVRKE